MPYSLLYRRPSYVSSRTSSLSCASASAWSIRKCSQSDSASNSLPNGVPTDLSFDRIITGQTCKPCTIRDFMNYLIYVEHSAENLQFFLWYRDYLLRFANLPASEKALSPLWLDEKFDLDGTKPTCKYTTEVIRPSTAEEEIEVLPNFNMTLEAEPSAEDSDGVSTLDVPTTLNQQSRNGSLKVYQVNRWDGDISTIGSPAKADFRQVASCAFESHDIVAPFTIQPYREEVTRIIATYIAEGSPRELNLAARERASLLRALASTTHPSAFGRVAASVETSLRRQSHPNFVRWSICNGERERITFAMTMGISNLLFGLVVGIVLTLSNVPRGFRALSAIFLVLGISTMILAGRGICVMLNMLHRCHLQPWELFEEEPDTESVHEMKHTSFDSFGSANSWEDQPWVSKYKKLGVLRRIFGREQRVNEPALRKLHDTMVLQSLVGAVVGTIVLEAIFLAVPGGHLF